MGHDAEGVDVVQEVLDVDLVLVVVDVDLDQVVGLGELETNHGLRHP